MSAVARERESAQEDIFHTLLSHYSTAPATRGSRSNSSFPTAGSAVRASSGSFARGRTASLQSLADSMKELQRDQQMKKYRLQRMAEMGGWKYEQAIEKVEQKEQWLLDQRKEHQWPDLKAQLERFAPRTEDLATANDELVAKIACQSKMGEVSTLQQRLINPLEQARDVSQVFPSRPLLRVKRTWRCVESIERGSAGILVKPQISPMSGDSSLPVPASWFKKANLAIHYMPIVTFQKLPYRTDAAGGVECILLIENPLDEAIQLVLRPISVDSEEEENRPDQAKALVKDFTAITVGPYEDPNIADAFISDASADHMDQEVRNAMAVHSTRNLVQIKLPIQASANARSITFGLQLEMVKYDEELQQVIENSTLSFPVELVARVEP
ncbi:hypothetical protein FI667_g14086, partial [Globisporangium splendens]